MTMREADAAAVARSPVVLMKPGCKPVEYARIVRTGYAYDEEGRHGFVQLLDKCSNSVTDADPANVEVQEKERDVLHESSERV